MNTLKIADRYHQITKEIIDLKNKGESIALEMAKRLKTVRDEKMWQMDGHASFYSYLAQPEISLDRTVALKWIQIYETFIEKYALAPERVSEIGYTKLAKIVPHVTDDNYDYYVEKAESLSRSDLDTELKDKGLITYKEPEAQHVECPQCHYVFDPKKRKEMSFAQTDYNKVIKAYEEAKETKFEGKEYDPIMQSIKTMFVNGRSPAQIIATIDYLSDQDYDWTIHTVKNKIAEILPKLNLQPKNDLSAEDEALLKGVGAI